MSDVKGVIWIHGTKDQMDINIIVNLSWIDTNSEDAIDLEQIKVELTIKRMMIF